MKSRLCCLLLVGSACWGSDVLLRAQDGASAAGDKPAPGTAQAQPLTESWSTDFWPRWPKETENFRDCFAATWSDALALGYFLDSRSLSPDGKYGVIIPRFGVVREGPNFIVDVPQRWIVGALDGKGFAFPQKAAVGWRYRWAPDGTALAIEQTGEPRQDLQRVSWRLVELRDGYIAKETDLLKNPGKIPAWLDRTLALGYERSAPPAGSTGAPLAQSSAGDAAWKVRRDPEGGPLRIVQKGARAGTLPPVRSIGADAKGVVRELTSEEMPGLPLCFFSLNEEGLFVNQITRVDPGTGTQWRTGALYRLGTAADGSSAQWSNPLTESFEEQAWNAFSQQSRVPPKKVGPPDASGFRDRTIEFVNWSPDSRRILLYLRARNENVTDKNGQPAYFRWYTFFDVKKLEFETTIQIDDANDDLRKRWNTADESLPEPMTHLRAENPGDVSFFAPTSAVDDFAEDDLNKNYRALLERVGPEAVEEVRRKQRAWLAYRDTLSRIHVLNRWSSFATEALLHEGRFLATHLQAEVLKNEAVAAQPGANIVLREKSPDGKFGLLYTYSDEDVAHEGRVDGVEVVALPARKKVIDLFDDSVNRSLKATWSADSKYLAFHASSRRVGGFTIYERRGDTFEALEMPELTGEKYAAKRKKGEREYHFDGSDLVLKRWLGPGKLLAHYSVQVEVEDTVGHGRPATADFDLVLAIVKGKVIIEKATRTEPEN